MRRGPGSKLDITASSLCNAVRLWLSYHFPVASEKSFPAITAGIAAAPAPPNPPGQSVSSVLPQWWPLHESDVRTRPPSLRPLARDPQRPSGLELVENLRELQL